MANKIIKLIRGFNQGMIIKVTDERNINGIPWIGGEVVGDHPHQRGGQWKEGEDYIIINP